MGARELSVILRQCGDMANTRSHNPGGHHTLRQGHCPGSEAASTQGLPITSSAGHPSSYPAVSPAENKKAHREPLDTRRGFHGIILARRSFQ